MLSNRFASWNGILVQMTSWLTRFRTYFYMPFRISQEAIRTKTKSQLQIYSETYINQEANRTNACNTWPTCSKTQYFLRKRTITMHPVRKRTNISKSSRKSTSQEAICTERLLQLANLFESIHLVYIKRPAVRKYATCHRPVRKHKCSIRKRTHNPKCEWKSIIQ